MKFLTLTLAVAATFVLCLPVYSDDKLPAEHVRFFESAVRPLLVEHCWKCHGPESQKGQLRLDSRNAMLAGGESGPAIVIGKPDESLLVEAVRYQSLEMPPSGKLPADKIETLAKWIKLGAPWPGSDDAVAAPREKAKGFTDDDRGWWALQPLRDTAPPELSGSSAVRNDIDRFIVAKLNNEGMVPAAEADRETLIRRLSFDLIGLPPSPQDVEQFVNDKDPQAYEHLVDRLLESPRYGERWARHWLDLVRYADSDGYRIDHYRPNAWRYRDYVIQSLNDDKPYDRFVQEQLAGDEMFPDSPEARVATGYLRHGIYEYNNRDVRGQWDIILNEVTDTTGDVFLGLGMQCARCHDHKFDPILQRDYFRLRAFFEPMLPRDDQVAMTAEQLQQAHDAAKAWEEQTAALREQIAKLEEPYREKGRREAIGRFPDDIQQMIRKPVNERTPREHQLAELAWRQVDFEYGRIDDMFKGQDKEQILALRRELAKFDAQRPKPLPAVQSVADVGPVAPTTVIPKKRTEVEPGFLTLLDEKPASITPPAGPSLSTGRRTALARWITRADNPLTTRVIVNRVWQSHFGQGLAANTSDFGRLGDPPTHPELLDWLTRQFLAGGWRLKPLHRLIVTSASYRQSTTHPKFADYMLKDPHNHLYWRADTRRLDAEQIRDAVLAVTGKLNLTAGGPGVLSDQPRRSIYTRVMRNARDPLLESFDLPLFFSSSASRDTTTSPIQSLLLINSPMMLNHATALAEQARQLFASGNNQAAVRDVYRRAWGREASPADLEMALAFLEWQPSQIGQMPEAKPDLSRLQTSKMPYRDGQSVILDPNNEKLRLFVPHNAKLDVADFTVEAYFQVRSVYDSGAVRTIAAKSNGDRSKPGWAFGVTGKGSRRKPQTLVMQLFGKNVAGTFGEAALFSDQHIELNKPYYAAASVHLAGDQPGAVTFFLKDLSNDDEPLLSAKVEHSIHDGFANHEPLSIGRVSSPKTNVFDGLIDDVRLSNQALATGELLFTKEGVASSTIGYWQFEAEPGVLQDGSPLSLDIEPATATSRVSDPRWLAFVDLCHVLLNSNQFLYVH